MSLSDRQAPMVGLAVLVVLALAGLVPQTRLPVLGLLVLGALAGLRVDVLRWPMAAGLPVALVLAWGLMPLGTASPGLLDCASPLSPPAVWRFLEALAVCLLVVGLARSLGSPLADLGLRRPGPAALALGVAAFLVLPIASLVLGPLLAEPFFGELALATSDAGAILPALVLAVSNGTLEELAYRGALLAWLAPSMGARAALVGQAVVFGAAHAGPDYVGPALPVLLVVAAGGLVAGLIVRRTGSLALPILVHAAFDVPLYYVAACRIS